MLSPGFFLKKNVLNVQFTTDLLQYHDEARRWRQLVVNDHVDGEQSQNTGLYGRQDQPRPQRQPQLGGGAVVQRAPEHQGVVGNEQGVDKHHPPGPGDCPQLPKGKEKQVKLQDQPETNEWRVGGVGHHVNDTLHKNNKDHYSKMFKYWEWF